MHDTDSIREDAALELDEAEILARLGGDRPLLAELCELSLAEMPRMIEPLAEAVRIGDANAVHRSAHRLKGSLSLFGAGPHIRDCEILEEMALKHDLPRAPELLRRLERHLKEFSAAVAALGKESHAHTDRR